MNVLVFAQPQQLLSMLMRPFDRLGRVGVAQTAVLSDIENFKPDIIFDTLGVTLPLKTIKLEMNKIQPYVDLDAYKASLDINIDFHTEVSYIGPLATLGRDIIPVMQRFQFKSFDTQPNSTHTYCGALSQHETFFVYRNSEVSIIPRGDIGFRKIDIEVSEVPYVEHTSDLVEAISKAIGTKPKRSKDEILDIHTNYDRIYSILKQNNYNEIAEQIMELK